MENKEHGRSDTVMMVTQTPLQAGVTNDQLLAAQLKRVKHPLLVKTCQKVEANTQSARDKGQRSSLECYNYW